MYSLSPAARELLITSYLSFKDPKFGTSGPAVFYQLLLSRKDGLSGNHLALRHLSTYTNGKILGTGAGVLILFKNRLYNPVFQRMEGNNTNSAVII
jgi:hypothetical protein